MTKESLIVLCASLCLSFSLPEQAEAQRGRTQTSLKEIRKADQAHPVADTTMLSGDRMLMADRVEIHKRIREQKKLRDGGLREEIKEGINLVDLEAPSVDLYGEESWGSHVNPFAGQNANIPASYDIDLREFVMPIEKRQVTSCYGYRRRFGRMHYGTDLKVHIGDTVRAAFSGKVRITSYERSGYGNYVVIRHTNGLETVYGHLSRSLVKEGAIIKAGEPIALGGNTGRSTGPHLHFEARFMGIPINPEELFDFVEGVPRVDTYSFKKSQAKSTGAHHAARKAKGASSGKNIRTHRISKGDTLDKIAKRYGTTVSKLRQTNGLTSNALLKPGKSLRIPS
ncbi:MAG: M23 family metallopeptidase [Porphyromonadaceae bacterium]|nr:M23 family metallopeptidase [Porphyromonadaceae bacterium]